jgi:hypothetical protein
MEKIMQKKITFLVFMLCITLGAAAQNYIKFDLQSNKTNEKEIVIKNSKNMASPSFSLFVEVTENPEDNSIELSFKRGADGNGLYLCYSLMKNVEVIKNLKECTSGDKKLWRDKKVKKELKDLKYFIKTNDLQLSYRGCYRQLPYNNSDGFTLPIVSSENPISMNLYFYVAKENKSSKKTTQLLYQVDPINIEINMTKETEVAAEINEQIKRLETLREAVKNAQKNKQKCAEQLSNIQQQIITDFPQEKPQWEAYKNNQNIAEGINQYKILRNAILNEKCSTTATATPAPSCILEDTNSRLMKLQMDITKKKANKESIENERKEFAEIKNLADKNIASSNCKKELITTYKNYCATIEKILNN